MPMHEDENQMNNWLEELNLDAVVCSVLEEMLVFGKNGWARLKQCLERRQNLVLQH